MKASPFISVLGILCIFSMTATGTSDLYQDEDELIVKARYFLTALVRGDFQAAARDFDETMMKVSGPEKLRDLWNQLPAQLGAFKKQSGARRDKLGAYDIALVTCEFEKVTLDVRVVFDRSSRITGFQFVPSVPPAFYQEPDYADSETFEEIEVVVGTGMWPLPGILAIPKGEGPFPALVLVHGSGPNDRDETLGPNKPFMDLALGLASRGIAVLRYDKRTKVFGPKIAGDRDLEASFTVKEETIDDALSAVSLLKRTERVDSARIFVLGHSLGGYLIPRIAISGRSLGISGFVIMAGLTRPLEDTILEQMTYLLAIDGSLSEEDNKRLESIESQVARIKALDESGKTPDEEILNAGVRYWLDLRGYDPPGMAGSVSRPFLVLQGSRDYQVTTEDFKNWQKALEGRPDVEFHLYPKLNHLFYEGQGLITPNEYIQKHGSVASYVIEDLAAWVQKH